MRSLRYKNFRLSQERKVAQDKIYEETYSLGNQLRSLRAGPSVIIKYEENNRAGLASRAIRNDCIIKNNAARVALQKNTEHSGY